MKQFSYLMLKREGERRRKESTAWKWVGPVFVAAALAAWICW